MQNYAIEVYFPRWEYREKLFNSDLPYDIGYKSVGYKLSKSLRSGFRIYRTHMAVQIYEISFE